MTREKAKYLLITPPSVVMSFWLLGDIGVFTSRQFSNTYSLIWVIFALFYFPITAPIYFSFASRSKTNKEFLNEVLLKSLVVTHIVYFSILLLAYAECFLKIYCNDSDPISSYAVLGFQWMYNIVAVSVSALILASIIFPFKGEK